MPMLQPSRISPVHEPSAQPGPLRAGSVPSGLAYIIFVRFQPCPAPPFSTESWLDVVPPQIMTAESAYQASLRSQSLCVQSVVTTRLVLANSGRITLARPLQSSVCRAGDTRIRGAHAHKRGAFGRA